MTAFRVRDAVEALPPYRGIGGTRPPVRLDGNENPLGPSPRAAEALQAVGPDVLSRYPVVADLRARWAGRLDVRPDELLLSAGSGPALALVAELVLDPGDTCLLLEPSFELYAWAARRRAADVVAVPLSRDFRFPTRAFRSALKDRRPRLVFLGYPDNPTGVAPARRSLEAWIAAHPETLFLVDEAYVEFTGRTVLPDAISWPNVLVARTFSKAMGLAGARVGGVAGSAPLIERLARINVPYPVTGPAAVLAAAALDDAEHVRRTVRQARRSVRRLQAGLREMDVAVRAPGANFVLADFRARGRAAAVCDALARRGVSVRDRSQLANLEGLVRISAGTDAETERVLDELRMLTAPGPEALLLDMDGTLVDVRRSYDEAIWRTVRALLPDGVETTRDAVLAVKADPAANDDIDAARLCLSRLGVRVSRRAVRDRFQALYLGGTRHAAGLHERERPLLAARVLARLADRLPLAVVTGRPRAEARMAIERFGWASLFQAVVTADDTRRRKPDAQPVRRALKALGVRAAWMVGDGPADLLAARAAGIPCVAVGSAGATGRLRTFKPLAVIDRTADLVQILAGRDRLAAAERTSR